MFRTVKTVLKSLHTNISTPKRVQDIIPIRQVWQDGIFLCAGVFSKTWRVADINYSVASQDDKREMFLHYSDLLNSLEAGSLAKVTVMNRKLDRQGFEQRMLLPMCGDRLDEYRQEYNEILISNAMTANNAIIQEKYITLSIPKKTVEEARNYFGRAGMELATHLSALGSFATDLNANERLRLFHDFFRTGEEQGYRFDLKESQRRGHAPSDYIAPDSYESINSNTIKLGEKFARVLFIRDFATYVKDSMLTELCDLSKTMALSIDILPIPTDEAVNEVQKRVMGVDTNITNWQRSQNKSGNFSADIPPTMELQRRESRELLEDLTTRDQRMYFGFVSLVHTADTKEELDSDYESLLSTSRKFLCQLAPLTFRQLDGLQTVLPFGISRMHEEAFRTLNTESLAVLMPFKAQEISHPHGTYFGQNAISKNLIVADRSLLLNGNGMILGVSGSGKSFMAKFEMVSKILKCDNDDILAIDPENEYAPLIKAMGGEVIRIAADSRNHINALDMSESYGGNDNPVVLKSEFILSLCDLVMGAGKLSAKEKSLVDRCVASVYRRFVQSGFEGMPPTLQDFHSELLMQEESEAKDIALAIELFTSGSLNTFAQQTNVNTQNRIVCYNIRDLGKQLKTIGMLVVLDSIFNRITQNREQGRRTWILIDELYLLFANEYSANYLFELWKRIRKYGGFCSGITQNLEDMLQSHTARTMLANSEFLIMLNQAPTDRQELSKLLNISETQLSYITNSTAGKGLIKCAGNIVPFENTLPRDSKLYKLMTTKLEEV